MDREIQVGEGMGETPSPRLDEKVAKWLDQVPNQVQEPHVPPCIAVAPIPNVSGAVDVLAPIPYQEGEPPMLVDQVPFFKS